MTNSYYLDNNYIGKEVKIDWFQVTFDFIPVTFYQEANRYILNKKDVRFIELIKILNPPTELIKKDYDLYIEELIDNLESKRAGRFRFDNGYMLGEHIEISYGGNKTSKDTYPVSLIFSGQACREFELAGGDWIKLFKFILQNASIGHLKIGRLDIAIDDFSGDEITPYKIEPYIRNHYYISNMRKVNFNISENHSDNPETEGFTITFGTRGSTMLQIYDKKLERKNKNEVDKDTNIWYRYEMRFYEDKALQVLTKYLEAFDLDNSLNFMDYAKGVLKGLLDIKKFNPNDSRKNRWETLHEWDLFLNSLSKVDLRRKTKIDTTIDKKVEWIKTSLATSFAQLALIQTEDELQDFITELVANADFKEKHLKIVNNHLRKENKELISMDDVKEKQESYKNLDFIKNDIDPVENLYKKLSNLVFDNYSFDYDSKCLMLYDQIYQVKIVEDFTGFSSLSREFYVNPKDTDNKMIIDFQIKGELRKLKKNQIGVI